MRVLFGKDGGCRALEIINGFHFTDPQVYPKLTERIFPISHNCIQPSSPSPGWPYYYSYSLALRPYPPYIHVSILLLLLNLGVMAFTTLVTFMLQTPTTVFSVEILGSWDNFSKPYQLKRDRKTGPGQWRGCHTFENITCDGDTLNQSTSRDGGLKMGGTYWYYYVLDGDVEYHDPAEPSTNICPLLPGQMLNVLEVPVQGSVLFGGSRNASSSSLDSAVFTMDPQDKYLPSRVRRATTTPAVHARKACLSATSKPAVRAPCNGSIGPKIVPQLQTSKTTRDVLILERQHSLLSVFHRMRQTRSAGSNAKSNLVWPRKIFSRAGQRKKQETSDTVPEIANLHDNVLSPSPTTIGEPFELPIQLPSAADHADRAPTAVMVNFAGPKNDVRPLEKPSFGDQSISLKKGEQGLEDRPMTSPVSHWRSSFSSSYHTPLEEPRDAPPYLAPSAADQTNDVVLSDYFGQLDLAPYAVEPLADLSKPNFHQHIHTVPLTESSGSLEHGYDSPNYGYAESLASYAASANFSPCLASNTTHSGLMSPCHLSQPETPVMSEFGDELLPALRDFDSLDLDLSARPSSSTGPPKISLPQQSDTQDPHATLGGFQGYTLHDRASVLTIRKLPSLTLEKTDATSPFAQQGSRQDLVHSWNDGSERHMSALGELVDDLGYLGHLII